MELALLTDAYIVISIYDACDKRVTTFQSHEIDPVFNEISINAHERFRPGDVSINLHDIAKWARCPQLFLYNEERLKLAIYYICSTINTYSKTTMNLSTSSIICCRRSASSRTWRKAKKEKIRLLKARPPQWPSMKLFSFIWPSILKTSWLDVLPRKCSKENLALITQMISYLLSPPSLLNEWRPQPTAQA